MYGLSLFLALVGALTAAGQEPTMTVPPEIKIKAGTLTALTLETTAVSVLWVCTDPKAQFADSKFLADKKGALVIAPKGSYTVVVIAIGPMGQHRREVTTLVAEEGKDEGPGDLIPPAKPPVIPKVAQKLRVVVVETDAASTTAQQNNFNSGKLSALFLEKGHRPLVIDKGLKERPPPDFSAEKLANHVTYIDAAAGKKLPWLFITPLAGGKALYAGPLPANEDLLKLLMELGG